MKDEGGGDVKNWFWKTEGFWSMTDEQTYVILESLSRLKNVSVDSKIKLPKGFSFSMDHVY